MRTIEGIGSWKRNLRLKGLTLMKTTVSSLAAIALLSALTLTASAQQALGGSDPRPQAQSQALGGSDPRPQIAMGDVVTGILMYFGM
jgi:hypothetical protein